MMYLKKAVRLFLFSAMLSCPFVLLSQNVDAPPRPFRGAVKLSLLDMVDLFGPSFQIGTEQKIANKLTLHVEGGPITTFGGNYLLHRDLTGYKFRGELRLYDRDGFSNEGISYGLQFMLKHDSAEENGDFVRGNGAFFQNLDYGIDRDAIAGHFTINILFPLGGKSIVEFSAWGGLRRLRRTWRGVPDDAEFADNFGIFVSRDPGEFTLPSLGMALRVGVGW